MSKEALMPKVTQMPAKAGEYGFATILPRKHPGWYVSGAVLILLMLWFGMSLAQNQNIDYATVAEYFSKDVILGGVANTLLMALISMVFATLLGTLLAVMRLAGGPVWSAFSWGYVWFFRSVPLLVLIIFCGNLGLLFERLGLAIPFTDIYLFSVPTNAVMTAFVASIVALTLHEAAYMAEIIRSGILSVPAGQRDATKALAIPGFKAFFLVTMPQAMRIIIPPTGSSVINTIKATSLVSVIAGSELLTRAENISATNLKTIELLLVASIWYLIIASVAGVGQYYLERKFGRGFSRSKVQAPQASA
ncbi:amino acid ABC transporter permease [Glutamicibacter uratoxydans]|uniref:amino acid ABC transporter permease n=1 Tax=Glutamicibacter uratoxydans TaxID=43667 RepID=UPI003D6FE6A4